MYEPHYLPESLHFRSHRFDSEHCHGNEGQLLTNRVQKLVGLWGKHVVGRMVPAVKMSETRLWISRSKNVGTKGWSNTGMDSYGLTQP